MRQKFNGSATPSTAHVVNRYCQTNRLKHQKPGEREFYEAIRKRHSVRAASLFSLKVLRVDSDRCELDFKAVHNGS